MFDHQMLRDAIATDKRREYTQPSKKVEKPSSSIFHFFKIF